LQPAPRRRTLPATEYRKVSTNSRQAEAAEIDMPPLAEQHRIVAKVNELMTLCDHLDVALDRAESHRTGLLDALLHEALSTDSPTAEAA
jgi:type I restriction enzyme S subunit